MTGFGKALQMAAAKLGIALSDDQVTAMEFAANTYLGRESNEGEKAERRRVAVAKILEITCSGYHLGASADVGALDAIVKEAQG